MKIVGMLSVYNDDDIIEEIIQHLISQGIDLVVLDNGSTDGTYEICKKFVGKGILDLFQYKTDIYDGAGNSRMLYQMALRQSPDWIIKNDSDEFLESGSNNMTLKESIKQVDSEDYNLIQFDRFDFFMTDNDNESAKSIREKMPYYSCQGDYLYRAWKYNHGTKVGEGTGHYPIFPEGIRYKIYPRKFTFRHYTFRSTEQAEKKMADKLRNLEKNTKIDKRNDSHINKILRANYSEKIDHKLLTKYEEDKNWNLERKYCPFLDGDGNHPTRDKIFTGDGWLKNYPLTVNEYKHLFNEMKRQENKKIKNKIKKVLSRF